jgi:hypothetical protein
MLLSPLGERLGEGVMQEAIFGLTPSPNLSPKGERNMKHERPPRGEVGEGDSKVRATLAEAARRA